MKTLWAKRALTAEGWQSNVGIAIDDNGFIDSVSADSAPVGERYGLILPAPANLHSHAFQRAMAGLTESRGGDSTDSFWTWRRLMYRFLDQLTPDHVEAITAFVQMEMLESGYAAVGEFHYLHNAADGGRYQNPAEMSERIVAAASLSGIGLCLLPVLYQQGGCDGRALSQGQRRFGNTQEQYGNLVVEVRRLIGQLPEDCGSGIAPHSLRAVTRQGLRDAIELAQISAEGQTPCGAPIHIHVAEQLAEVEELINARAARPVEWLLANHDVDANWCIIHATQMLPHETTLLARSGATVGLCPITESSLGDGIFDGMRYRQAGGCWGVGSDSNIRISLSEELRTLEYSQRLRDHGRAMFADKNMSCGRVLYDHILDGGARALQRKSGSIVAGNYADLLHLDEGAVELCAVSDNGWLDAWIFAADDRLVRDVWSAGRHMVKDGIHVRHDAITARYREIVRVLVSAI